MKIKELIEKLREYDNKDEIVIQTQKGHCLYGDIGCIDVDDYGYVVMGFKNEGYSPAQALGGE